MPRDGRSITDAERDNQSIIELVRRFSDELLTLFRQEMALATAEVSRTIRKLAAGAASVAAGAAVLFAGFLTLLAAAVLGLSHVLEPWLAAAVVGVAVTIVGVVLLIAGKKTLQPENLKPERTVDSLREDKDVLMRRAS
jgi:lipopolysaccharide export LptBFGC system permease protein LptF